MMVNKSGQAAAMSSASGVNGLSSCFRMGACSKGGLIQLSCSGHLLKGTLIRGGRALNQAITVISFLGS